MKNLNVTVSDEIAEQMERFSDVNWSAVTRSCIEQYIKQRTSGGLDSAISKIKELKGDQFKKGYEFVIQNSEKIGLAALEEIAYPDHDRHINLLFDILTSNTFDEEPTGEINAPSSGSIVDDILSYDVDLDNPKGVSGIQYRVSSKFIEGMREAAKELLSRS